VVHGLVHVVETVLPVEIHTGHRSSRVAEKDTVETLAFGGVYLDARGNSVEPGRDVWHFRLAR